MADKTGWTEPLDSKRRGLGFVRWRKRRVVADALRRLGWRTRMVCPDAQLVRSRFDFNYDRWTGEGQRRWHARVGRRRGNVALTETLLARGADVELADNHGRLA